MTAIFILVIYRVHLGNVRLTYADTDGDGSINPSSEIISEKNYYPFGLQHKGYNSDVTGNVNSVAENFGYNGKENNPELGLEWMDFGARNYDAALGRWMNIDPLAEQMRRHSPYNFAFNNPLRFIDPDGMAPQDLIFKFKTDSARDKVQSNLDAGLGEGNASIDDNGKVTLNVKREDLETDEQRGFFDVLSKPIDSKNDTTISVTESDDRIIIGEFGDQAIDIDDVNAFGSAEPALTKNSVLAHEVNEQYEKQDLNNTEYSNEAGTGAHQNSFSAETTVTGYERGDTTPTTPKTYNKVTKRGRNRTRTYYSQSYGATIDFTKGGVTKKVPYQVINGNVKPKQ